MCRRRSAHDTRVVAQGDWTESAADTQVRFRRHQCRAHASLFHFISFICVSPTGITPMTGEINNLNHEKQVLDNNEAVYYTILSIAYSESATYLSGLTNCLALALHSSCHTTAPDVQISVRTRSQII